MSRLLSTLLLVAATACLNSCSTPGGNADFTVRKDVVFTPASWPAPLVADFYRPQSASPTAAVLLIHGGGWSGTERRPDMAGIARNLARRGYLVKNTTYRLTPQWQFPAQKIDIDEALRHMRANAVALNLDPQRIATFGYSAGGHLAALAGLDPRNDIRAIVAGGAPSNLALWPDGQLTGLLLGGPLSGNEAAYHEASPVTHVSPESPPVFREVHCAFGFPQAGRWSAGYLSAFMVSDSAPPRSLDT